MARRQLVVTVGGTFPALLPALGTSRAHNITVALFGPIQRLTFIQLTFILLGRIARFSFVGFLPTGTTPKNGRREVGTIQMESGRGFGSLQSGLSSVPVGDRIGW
jgi:hypothetical protein